MPQVLDHGYIKYIRGYGSDRAVIEDARMSTMKGFRGWARDSRLLEYLYRNNHCYDEQTEVLTNRGFIPWSEVRDDDLLGQWDEVASSLVYERPYEVIRDDYEGGMYSVIHGGVDLLVTLNHKMYVKTQIPNRGVPHMRWEDGWRLVSAVELSNRSMVRYRKHAEYRNGEFLKLSSIFPSHKNTLALLKFIGFFVGDGHAGGTYTNAVTFHLKKKRKIVWLEDICQSLGWHLEKRCNNNYIVRVEGITNIFRSEFYDSEGGKRIPNYLLQANSVESKAILEGLKNSDGSLKRGAWVYSTTSEQVAESLQILVLHSGGSCSISCRDNYIYRVTVFSRMLEPVINQGKVNTTTMHYRGRIFCAHTRTGVLVVRRNNKIVLSGNSTPFEGSGATFEIKAPILVFREWQRHRSQSFSEMSGRYVVLPNENYIPEAGRILDACNAVSKNKQIQGVDVSQVNGYTDAYRVQERLQVEYACQQMTYESLLAQGLPKELARIVLPVGRYSVMRATANLRNWLAFLTLRNDPAAQYEIRVYAEQLEAILERKFPRTLALFNDNRG